MILHRLNQLAEHYSLKIDQTIISLHLEIILHQNRKFLKKTCIHNKNDDMTKLVTKKIQRRIFRIDHPTRTW